MSKLFTGFKEFISRGSAIDLAVGVVMGAAFAKITDALVNAVINPLIAALFGQPNLDAVAVIPIGESKIAIGVVLTAVVNFLLVSFAIYLFVVLPINKLRARADAKKAAAKVAEPVTAPADIALLTEIRDLLRSRQ